jgi:hypothetical protein
VTDLDVVLNAHQASLDCLDIVGVLLNKSRGGTTFHNTIFFKKSLEETNRLLFRSKEEMGDSTIISLTAAFERIIFHHLASSSQTKD